MVYAFGHNNFKVIENLFYLFTIQPHLNLLIQVLQDHLFGNGSALSISLWKADLLDRPNTQVKISNS